MTEDSLTPEESIQDTILQTLDLFKKVDIKNAENVILIWTNTDNKLVASTACLTSLETLALLRIASETVLLQTINLSVRQSV